MISQPPRDKMMRGAPVEKRKWFFAGDGAYRAREVEAATLAEAEEIWHKVKEPFNTTAGAASSDIPSSTGSPALSTPQPGTGIGEGDTIKDK